MQMLEALAAQPVIAAVRQKKDLAGALASSVSIVFLLAGDLFTLPEVVGQVKRAGKIVFVHFDMVQGASKDAAGMNFMARSAAPDGIITTRANLVVEAKSCGLLTVQRTFLLDSQSVHTGIDLVKEAKPDILEVLPGVVPSEIQEVVRRIRVPLIAGGLIRSKSQCYAALRAGAVGVSTSTSELWNAALTAPAGEHAVGGGSVRSALVRSGPVPARRS